MGSGTCVTVLVSFGSKGCDRRSDFHRRGSLSRGVRSPSGCRRLCASAWQPGSGGSWRRGHDDRLAEACGRSDGRRPAVALCDGKEPRALGMAQGVCRGWQRCNTRDGAGGRAEVQILDPELERCLRALSLRDREALLLVAWEDLTPALAARSLGLSQAAFRVRLHRSRKRLRRLLEAGERTAAVPHLEVEKS